jgi:AP-3 complex subunit delta
VQLFTFIRADLASFRPEDPAAGLLANDTSQRPAYPKSLLLINPLFSNYQLNSVSVVAQESVPVPESLDLDVWIIPPPKEFSSANAAAADGTREGELPLTKKKVKGKGKGKGKEKVATLKSRDTQPDILSPGPPETEEEKTEREKVSSKLVKLASAHLHTTSATAREDGASSKRPILYTRQTAFGAICQ